MFSDFNFVENLGAYFLDEVLQSLKFLIAQLLKNL